MRSTPSAVASGRKYVPVLQPLTLPLEDTEQVLEDSLETRPVREELCTSRIDVEEAEVALGQAMDSERMPLL